MYVSISDPGGEPTNASEFLAVLAVMGSEEQLGLLGEECLVFHGRHCPGVEDRNLLVSIFGQQEQVSELSVGEHVNFELGIEAHLSDQLEFLLARLLQHEEHRLVGQEEILSNRLKSCAPHLLINN